MSEDILVHRENGVLTLTFNRVDKKNAITTTMYQTLASALRESAEDDSVRVAVLQGAVEIFSAGNDLADFLKNPPNPNELEKAPVVQFLQALHAFPKPIVAAVCGPAVGIGATMLLHCDLVYAGDNAAFSLPFVNLGVCAEGGSSVMLPQLVGFQRAAEKLLLGEAFYAEEALDMGIVSRILPPGDANAYAQAQAAKLAAKPTSSLRVTKALMRKSQPGMQDMMLAEIREFVQLLSGPAAKEAITAVMEKRKPDFSKF